MSDDRVIKTKDGESGLIKRGARLILQVGLTIVVVAGAVFAVQFGASELGRRADAAPTPDAADLIPVSASPVIVQDSYRVTRSFIGQVEPQKTVSLSFELPGRIDTIHVNEGDWVAAGQVLADEDL
ncbi:MAG: biotin/lipoyl-binding protein, partial [Pseudomonadota bacterium]